MKKFYYKLPRFLKRFILRRYENYYRQKTARRLKLPVLGFSNRPKNPKPRILFYFIGGAGYGGVSKMMQVFAKHLDPEKYEVYFMYSAKPRAIGGRNLREDGRKSYFNGTAVHLIEHSYSSMDGLYPYVINDMEPGFTQVVKNNNIDALVVTGSGYTEFPFNMVTGLPIIMFNIFGSPAVQENFKFHLCISREVAEKITGVVDEQKIQVMYIPSERPPAEAPVWGQSLRDRLGLTEHDVVFGRIGRGVDDIFDPIGIRAFREVVKKYNNAHYLIMSPPPALEHVVAEQKIPNVHFLPASFDDEDIWGFHCAVDVLGHFRKDGESFGLNIAESMLCGKPILSHKSHFWNAHLEYLENSFSRVAEADNVAQYAEYMEYFINLSAAERSGMGELARQKAEKLFLIENNIGRFEQVIKDSI